MAIEVYPGDIPKHDENQNNSVAPTTSVQDDGYPTSAEPPSSEHNYLFNRLLRAALSQRQKPVKDWLTATDYEEFELVINPDVLRKLYQANTAHTSTGATLKENDLANWDIISESLDDLEGPFIDGEYVAGDTATGLLKKATLAVDVAGLVAFDPGIINGNMDIWQVDTSATPATSGQYFADLFQYSKVGPQTHNISRSTDVPAISDGAPFTSFYSLQMIVDVLNTAVDATELTTFTYRMEGFDFGRYFDRTFTINFWVRGNNTGTYSVAFSNFDNTRSYVATYVINSANTWEPKTIPVVHDTTGVWNLNANSGLQINFAFAGGANFEASAANQWEAGNFLTVAGTTNFDATASNQVNIAQVSLNEGSIFRNNIRTIESEMPRVARQFTRYQNMEYAFRKDSGTDEARYGFPFNPRMRAAPVATATNISKSGNVSDPTFLNLAEESMTIQFVAGNAVDENVIINFNLELNARVT